MYFTAYTTWPHGKHLSYTLSAIDKNGKEKKVWLNRKRNAAAAPHTGPKQASKLKTNRKPTQNSSKKREIIFSSPTNSSLSQSLRSCRHIHHNRIYPFRLQARKERFLIAHEGIKVLWLVKKALSVSILSSPSTPQIDTLLWSLCVPKILPALEEYRNYIFSKKKSIR